MNNRLGDLPVGAKDDIKAPYNDGDAKDITFKVNVCCALYGCGSFVSDNYDKDTENFDGTERDKLIAFEKQNITPLQLIQEYKAMMEFEFQQPSTNKMRKDYLRKRIDACSVWEKEEIDEGEV